MALDQEKQNNQLLTQTDSDSSGEDFEVASQWRLMWWRFKKHTPAMVSGILILFLYFVTIHADFLATSSPTKSSKDYIYIPPQSVKWFQDGKFSPHTYVIEGARNMTTYLIEYGPKTDADGKIETIPVSFFTKGYCYKYLGFIRSDIHLLGIDMEKYKPAEFRRIPDTTCGYEIGNYSRIGLFTWGSDKLGRDLFSRMVVATRISMSIGLLGVTITLVLGIVIGGISGYYGGIADIIIQRLIEFLNAIPTLPLWMALGAALPLNWPIYRIYFALVVILSLLGWTGMARVVRSKFLSLREEDYVMAARLVGASEWRVMFRHMLPGFMSYIIASVTLSIPGMIIGETSLSFLGLGLRPPAISWGVLLQAAQNIQTIALYPWLMMPGLAVTVAVLVFNFFGDGWRDAADPYGK